MESQTSTGPSTSEGTSTATPTTRIPYIEGRDKQPQALERVVAHIGAALAGPTADRLSAVRRPLFTGIGASHAALAVPVERLRAAGIAAQRVLAHEICDNAKGFDTDLVVGVSQSGRSSETIAAFKALDHAARLAVLNVTPSPLGELATLTVDLGNEPDSFASTIGFTGTVVALDLIAAAIAGERDAAQGWSGIAEKVAAVRTHAADVISTLSERAGLCVAADFVASGASRASAEEGALLLREVARTPSAASATRNYLHGEMESAGRTLHVVFGDGREIELARTLADAGHLTVLITSMDAALVANLAVIRVPAATPAARVVLETVVTQELAAALAVERQVPVEGFVFANNDTKQGGLDPAAFAARSSTASE
ncbi:sugar isomerase (SIS) [Catenulispora acidiphila DSM 44928]|uniref:Glutamine--fructose-6-phosphate aminotransferase [isomerizing] n=1 Tax=Catenulispora acidiphila (strain DSM 44928 / JCM 14897 / NBRC 102108 / NRRL B-24433 / ID139908) TaxID=479433 RepID=C7PZ78_CATAD|nr:SIS domain-containing protein [Catenulispora acidiphila]ACU71535.1 sugar isomerase (SIS) [Catenulispora acidiphila DSM 44928]